MSSDDEPLVDAGTPDTSEVDPAEFGCLGDGALCNPLRRPHRFVVLSLICFLSFGSYYCYDNPAALAPQFKTDLDLEVWSGYVRIFVEFKQVGGIIFCFTLL